MVCIFSDRLPIVWQKAINLFSVTVMIFVFLALKSEETKTYMTGNNN